MIERHLRELRRTEARETRAIEAATKRTNAFSIAALVRSKIRELAFAVNGDAQSLESASYLDRACYELSGQVANGTWVPYAALTRGLTAASDTTLITPQVSAIQDALRPVSGVVAAGATVIGGLRGGDLQLPLGSSINLTSGWQNAEGDTATQAEPTFAQIAVVMKTVTAQVRVTRQLLRDSSPALDSWLRSAILAAFATEIDRVALVGATASDQPDGLLVNSDVPVVAAGTNGAAPDWDLLTELERTVGDADGRLDATTWITSPKTLRKLRRTPITGSAAPMIVQDSPRALGHDMRVSTLVPDTLSKGTSSGVCSALLLGDFSEVFIGQWGPAALDILVDAYTLATSGIVRITARADIGIALRNTGAFAVCKDVLAA